MIQAGVGKVRGRANACGSSSSAKGVVKVSVKVGPGGNVTGVTVKQSPDDALGNCVANAMKGATFGKTTGGGSFAIPFTF
jgi:TonB family protein